MNIKDGALKQILQEYHDSEKEEFSKYEMSVIKEIYLDNDSDNDGIEEESLRLRRRQFPEGEL